MKKLLLIITAALIFSLLGMGNQRSAAQTGTEAPTFTPTPTQATIDLGGNIQLQNQESHEKIDSPKLTVDVAKPVVTGPKGPTVDNFNAAVDQIVEQTAGTFKKDTLNQPTEVATLPPEIAELGNFIDVSYQVLLASPSLVSVKFNIFFYNAGAAHPNSGSATLNYDMKAARVLKLADLFKPNAKYLDVLSAYAIKTLKAAGKLNFPEGAAPKEENYSSWNIRKDGIQINFDDYQVTPHAAGPQMVVVPYSQLKAIIRADGPLAGIAK